MELKNMKTVQHEKIGITQENLRIRIIMTGSYWVSCEIKKKTTVTLHKSVMESINDDSIKCLSITELVNF